MTVGVFDKQKIVIIFVKLSRLAGGYVTGSAQGPNGIDRYNIIVMNGQFRWVKAKPGASL